MSNILNYFEMSKSKTDKELDEEMFKGTKYEGMQFIREYEGDNYYASPVFRFANGDRVVINKMGNIMVLGDTLKKRIFKTEIFTIAEKKPENGAVCWVVHSPNKWPSLLTYNDYDNCWDDEDGDDYMYDVHEDDIWFSLPSYKEMTEE